MIDKAIWPEPSSILHASMLYWRSQGPFLAILYTELPFGEFSINQNPSATGCAGSSPAPGTRTQKAVADLSAAAFPFSQAPHPPAGQIHSREGQPGRPGRLFRGIVQAGAGPGINKGWPRKRPPPGRCRHADARCRKGCPASPVRPRPAGPAWSNVTRRAASRSPPGCRCPPLHG